MSQCEKRSKALKRIIFRPERPAEMRSPPHDQIGDAQCRDHAEDHDRAAPMQENFVEIIPGPSGGLDQHGCLRIGNVYPSFSARHLLEQVAFAGDACSRIRRAIGAELLCDRRGRRHEGEHHGKEYEANACKKHHDDHPPLVFRVTHQGPRAQPSMPS